MSPDTYLGRIVAAHRASSAGGPVGEKLLMEAEAAPPPRGFSDRIAASTGLGVIAEIKRRSPSKGDILPQLDPRVLAQEYCAGGAACLSVLTDEEFFSGSAKDLIAARATCDVPVLRKDFTVCEADVCEARIMGADAVLLITAALSDEELSSFHTLAQELAMDALVEVHDEDDLERALEVGAELIGVNQRDLRSFEVDRTRAARLAAWFPPEVIAVAESGIEGPDDARRLADAGNQAVLVGEWLLRGADRASGVEKLRGHEIGSRAPKALAARGSQPPSRPGSSDGR